MAQIQVTPGLQSTGAGAIVREAKFAVETRQLWSNPWERRLWLYPVSITEAVAPSIGQALFEYTYGRIKRVDRATIAQHYALEAADVFIRVVDTSSRAAWWTGLIDSESKLPVGGRKGAGNQEFGAFGICHLLERTKVDWAQARDGNGATTRLDWVPVVNDGAGRKRGNRSSTKNAGGLYEFSDEGEEWSNLDVLDMLLGLYPPADGPVFELGGQFEALAALHDRIELDGRSLWEILNDLISRRRGLGFAPVIAGEKVVLSVYPILEQAVTLGGVQIPANTNACTLNVDSRIEILSCKILRSNSLRVDELTVRGSRILVCGTVAQADGTLADDAPAALVSAYKDAASGAADYASLTDAEKEERNDRLRAEDKFAAVYVRQRIPRTWDGMLGNGEGGQKSPAIPVCTDEGEIKFPPDIALQFSPLEKHFEATIPLEEDKDYAAGVPEPSAEPKFLPPLAMVQDEETPARWHLVNEPGEDLMSDGAAADMSVYASSLALGIKASPQHVYGKGSFEGGAASAHEPLLRMSKTLATVAFYADSALRIRVQRAGAEKILRRMSIKVNDAEYWYVAAGTVLGLNTDGSLKRVAGPLVLRDDSARLWEIAAAALAWYGNERRAIFLTLRAIENLAPLGALLESIVTANTEFEVNTILTSLTWDFRNRTTTMETAWAEADWST